MEVEFCVQFRAIQCLRTVHETATFQRAQAREDNYFITPIFQDNTLHNGIWRLSPLGCLGACTSPEHRPQGIHDDLHWWTHVWGITVLPGQEKQCICNLQAIQKLGQHTAAGNEGTMHWLWRQVHVACLHRPPPGARDKAWADHPWLPFPEQRRRAP